MSNVAIIGAGLAGSLLSIYLAKRGFNVSVYEARGDMRKETVAAGRSINLALSDRGIAALREIGMDEYMLAEAVPMYGRMVHSPVGATGLLPYSGRSGEYINSVSRAGLNIALLNEAERHANIRLVFDSKCIDFDCRTGEALFANGERTAADTVIATDGAGSAVRQAMQQQVPDFHLSSVFLDHGYKELHIPAGDDGLFRMEKNALHIWPRHKFMMIALPNYDGSFTCTLFLAHQAGDGEPGFNELTNEHAVRDLFESEFPDAVPLMPTLVQDFSRNPIGNLGTIKCFPWSIGGKALLLGDAAHAVVPFYGQGMNCSFEDVRVLDELIGKHGPQWQIVFSEYERSRKVNTDAIADMAEENFYEMRDAVADPVFLRKRELETRLERTYPDYFSKYSMVTFREDLPYSVAKRLGNAQDKLLMELCSATDRIDELDLEAVLAKVKAIPEAGAGN